MSHFVCDICGTSFSRNYSLKRHSLKRHCDDVHKLSFESFKCSWPNCLKVFSRVDNLRRHESAHKSSKFLCDYCGTSVSYKHELVRHFSTVHSQRRQPHSNFISNNPFECSECGLKVSRKDTLIQHIRNKHEVNQSSIKCDVCGALFRHHKNLKSHEEKKHGNGSRQCYTQTKVCALCKESFVGKAALIRHYTDDHHVQLQKQELEFSSKEEFFTWKMEMEKSTNSRFIKVVSNKMKIGMYSFYACHRSGMAHIKSTDRKRRLKIKGTKKLNAVCPAEIKVHVTSNGCKVSFLETHVGHVLTSDTELCHLYTHAEDRAQLDSKIASGVPLRRIFDDNRNDDLLCDLNKNLTADDSLRSMDLHSIETTLDVKPNATEPKPFVEYNADAAERTSESTSVCDETPISINASATCPTEHSKTLEYTTKKEELLKRFNIILNNASTVQHLKVVSGLLDPILPAILSITPDAPPSLNSLKEVFNIKARKIESQKRIFFQSTKNNKEEEEIINYYIIGF